MAKHTPGPWAIDPDDRPGMTWNNHIVVADNPDLRICFMANSGKPDNSECEANARLIAAAPTLADALRALSFPDVPDGDLHKYCLIVDAADVRAARAALKAAGVGAL